MSAAIYARVSTERQTLAQTIDQQIERLTADVHAQGETLRPENIFRDDGYSGTTLSRPGLDRLRDRVKEGTIDRVLLVSPDRLARHYVHQLVLLEVCTQAGCSVECLDQPLGQAPQAHLLLQIRGAVAAYERTLMAERMRRGRQRKLQAGVLLPGTIPPYGYRLHPDRPRDPAGVQIEPTAGAIVQEVFAHYLEADGTLLGVAKHLLRLGIRSPRGNRRWSAASLHGLLSNPAYAGKLYIGRTQARPARLRRSATHPLGKPASSQDPTPPEAWTLVTTIPPLVSQEDVDRVQAKLALNKPRASRNNKTHTYLLRALVSCGVCQSACMARTTTHGHRYDVCRCAAQPLYSSHDRRCTAHYSPAHQLDELVWHDLCDLLTHPEWIAYALKRAHGGHWLPQELQARKEALRKGQMRVTNQLERLTEAYLQGVIPLIEYQRRRQELAQQHQALATQEKQLETQVDRHGQLAEMVHSIAAFCQRIQAGLAQAPFAQKRTLDDITQILARPEETSLGEQLCLLKGLESWGIRRMLIDRNNPRGDRIVRIQHLPEELFSGLGVTSRTQHEVQRRPGRIDGPVEVVPLLRDFDVGFIYSVGIIRDVELRPTALVQLWRVALDPAKHGGMVDPHTPFLQEFFHIAIAQRVAQVPPHGAEDDVSLKVAPFEQRGIAHGKAPVT